MNNDNLITIITTSQTSEIKGGLPTLKNLSNKILSNEEITVTSEKLSLNLKSFLEKLKPVFEEQETQIGSFEISEIELSLAINTSGGIELIGKVDVGITGGIKIKLQKREMK